MRILFCMIIGLFLMTAANADDFQLKSSAFVEKAKIPSLYTCDGENLTPPLSWENAPANTQSFVLLFSDLESSSLSPFYHWVAYNIPGDLRGLQTGAENLPEGVLVGNNGFGDSNYYGPCPPDSHSHQYTFTLYALDKILPLTDGAEVEEVLAKMRGHILKKAELNMFYNH